MVRLTYRSSEAVLALILLVLLAACSTSPDPGALAPPFYAEAVLPTPTQIQLGEQLLVPTLPVVTANQDVPRTTVEQAERLLARRLEQLFGPQVAATTPSDTPFPILLERVGADHFGDAVDAERVSQAYQLHVSSEGARVSAASSAGLINGIATFIQLLHVHETRLHVPLASVVDAPAFTTRYVSEYFFPREEFFDWLSLYKLNGFASAYRAMRWDSISEEVMAGIERIGDYVRTYRTLRYMAQLHLGGRGGPVMDTADREQRERLLRTIDTLIGVGEATHLMLCYDDAVPELQPAEANSFSGPAEAHIDLLEFVVDHLSATYPDVVLSFVTPYYQGTAHPRWDDPETRRRGLAYLDAIREWQNSSVRIVWTGPLTESRRIRDRDVEGYRQLIGVHHPLFYWDNTWHFYQPVRHFNTRYPDDFQRMTADSSALLFIYGSRPIGRFFAATAGDYYWNPDDHDARNARRIAVAQFLGPDAVGAAERFWLLRGPWYFVTFRRYVPLPWLRRVLERLDAASLTDELPEYCWSVYRDIVEWRHDHGRRERP